MVSTLESSQYMEHARATVFPTWLGRALESADKAILVSQIWFWTQHNRKQENATYLRDGRWWWYHSLKRMQEEVLPWCCINTVRKYLDDLKAMGLVVTRREGGPQNPLWYSVEGEMLDRLAEVGLKESECHRMAHACTNLWHTRVPKRGTHIDTNSDTEDRDTPATPADAEVAPAASSLRSSSASGSSPLVHPIAAKAKNQATASPPVPRPPLSTPLRTKHLETYGKRFLDKGSAAALEKIWEILVVDRWGHGSFVAFTARDRRNAKQDLLPWCRKSGIDAVDFVQWVVAHWDEVTAKLAWAKLEAVPRFQQFFSLKDRVAVVYKGRQAETTGKVTFKSIADVPKNHPRYKELAGMFKKLGNVTLSVEA